MNATGTASHIAAHLRIDDSPASRVQRGRACGALFMAGGFLAFLVIRVLPGWPGTNPGQTLVVAGLCTLIGGLQIAFAHLVTALISNILFFTAAGAIALTQALSGAAEPAGMSIGVLYIWIAVLAALYLTPTLTGIYILTSATAHGLAIYYSGGSDWMVSQVLLTAMTGLMAAFVTATLAHRMRALATLDPLTKVANRRGGELAVERELSIARRSGTSLCIAILDLDGFKAVNDTNGHAFGDQVLVDVARTWTKQLRPSDTLARLGGDEFLMILPGADPVTAQATARRVLSSTPPVVGCSVGIACFSNDEDSESLVARADRAMYEAKGSGTGIVLCCDVVTSVGSPTCH